jgi:hypothetical protein
MDLLPKRSLLWTVYHEMKNMHSSLREWLVGMNELRNLSRGAPEPVLDSPYITQYKNTSAEHYTAWLLIE